MAGNSPLSTSAARRARSCRNTPAYAPALSHATLLLAPEAMRGRHAAKLVLTAPWSRLLSLHICFVRRGPPDPAVRPLVRRGSPDPAVWPTVGLQVTHRRAPRCRPTTSWRKPRVQLRR